MWMHVQCPLLGSSAHAQAVDDGAVSAAVAAVVVEWVWSWAQPLAGAALVVEVLAAMRLGEEQLGRELRL